jgi:hypothetical protein
MIPSGQLADVFHVVVDDVDTINAILAAADKGRAAREVSGGGAMTR